MMPGDFRCECTGNPFLERGLAAVAVRRGGGSLPLETVQIETKINTNLFLFQPINLFFAFVASLNLGVAQPNALFWTPSLECR